MSIIFRLIALVCIISFLTGCMAPLKPEHKQIKPEHKQPFAKFRIISHENSLEYFENAQDCKNPITVQRISEPERIYYNVPANKPMTFHIRFTNHLYHEMVKYDHSASYTISFMPKEGKEYMFITEALNPKTTKSYFIHQRSDGPNSYIVPFLVRSPTCDDNKKISDVATAKFEPISTGLSKEEENKRFENAKYLIGIKAPLIFP